MKNNKNELQQIEIKESGFGTTPDQFSELKIFRVDNVLARKVMSWSNEEAKIAAMAIAAMKPDGSGLNKFGRVIFKTNDLIKMMGLETANGIKKKQLREQIDQLMKHSFVEYTEEDLKYSSPDRTYEAGFIFPYSKEQLGWTYIEIGTAFRDKFTNLSSHFATIELLAVMSLSSKAVITLYQTFCSWVNTNSTITISEKQLKEIYEIDDDAYKRTDGSFARAMFEKRTIKQAIVEINNCQYSSIYISPKVKRNAVFSDEGKILGIKSYTFEISKKEKKERKLLESRIDITDIEVPQLKLDQATIFNQINQQLSVLKSSKKASKELKDKLDSLTEEDIKKIENNIIENGNVPVVADNYFKKCILNYVESEHLKGNQQKQFKDKLPAYMIEKIEMDQTTQKTSEELVSEIKDLIESLK